MGEDLFFILQSGNLPVLIGVLLLSLLRLTSALLVLAYFQFLLGGSVLILSAIAMCLSLPVFVAQLPDTIEIVDQLVFPGTLIVILREIVIGLILGVFLSLPFFTVIYSGRVLDQMRGETEGSIRITTSEMSSTYAAWIYLAGLLAFASLDGPLLVLRIFIQSFEIWSIGGNEQVVSRDRIWIYFDLFSDGLRFAVAIALPILGVFYAVEVVLGFASRIAQRLNLYSEVFLFKNLFGMICLFLSLGTLLVVHTGYLESFFFHEVFGSGW